MAKNVLFLNENSAFSMKAWVGDCDNLSSFLSLIESNKTIIEQIIPTKKKKHLGSEGFKLHEAWYQKNGKGWLIEIKFKPEEISEVVILMKKLLGDDYDVSFEESKMVV
jgi:hypothetical protein